MQIYIANNPQDANHSILFNLKPKHNFINNLRPCNDTQSPEKSAAWKRLATQRLQESTYRTWLFINPISNKLNHVETQIQQCWYSTKWTQPSHL